MVSRFTLLLLLGLGWPIGSLYAQGPWAPLEDSCMAAGGTGFSPVSGCRCPDESPIFTLTNGVGQCEAKSVLPSFNANQCPELYCDLYADRKQGARTLIGAIVRINLPSGPARDKIFESLPAGKEWPLSFTFDGYSFINRHGITIGPLDEKSGFNQETMELIGLSSTFLGVHNVDSKTPYYSNRSLFYSRNVEDLTKLLGMDKQAVTAEALGSNQEPWSQDLQQAYAEILQRRSTLEDPSLWKIELYRGNDCRDACRLSIELGRSSLGYRVRFVQEVLQGRIGKRLLLLEGPTQGSWLVAQLGPNLFPSLIVERQIRGDITKGFSEQLRIFDRTLELIHTVENPLLEAGDMLRRAQWTRASATMQSGASIATCEGDVGDFREDWGVLAQSLMIGPESNAFGWGQYETFVQPLYRQGFGTLGALGTSTQHLKPVVEAALSVVPDLKILPLGNNRCLEDFSIWGRPVQEAGAKVVSISQLTVYSKSELACSNLLARTIDSPSGQNLLWVVAAGNDSRVNEEGYGCLQMNPRRNLIVVGAGNSSGFEAYSNRGASFVDVVTSGKIGTSSGTSFAAPKVAALAASIRHQFPDLTPGEVKAALLLGSTPSPNLEEMSRSGAYLDLDQTAANNLKTLQFAECYQSREQVSVRDFKSCLGIRFSRGREIWPPFLKKLEAQGLVEVQ